MKRSLKIFLIFAGILLSVFLVLEKNIYPYYKSWEYAGVGSRFIECHGIEISVLETSGISEDYFCLGWTTQERLEGAFPTIPFDE